MKTRLIRAINARRITMIILALSSVAYFSSCNKSSDIAAYKFFASDTNATKEFKDIATIKRLTTNEAADFEWYLETSRFGIKVPNYLPEEFRVNNIQVEVSYTNTGRQMYPSIYGQQTFQVNITSIHLKRD